MWGLAKHEGRWLLPSVRCAILASGLLRFSSSSSSSSSSSPTAVCSDAPAAAAASAEPPGFMVEYLVSACALSRSEAVKTSRCLGRVKSPEKPDAVVRLMKQEGLGDAQIRRLVLGRPTVLLADVRKTLEPKIRALHEAGFSRSELAQLISAGGLAVPLRGVPRRIEFWRNIFGDNKNLLKAINRNSALLSLRLEQRVIPALSFLRSLGLSNDDFRRIVTRSRFLVTSSPEKIKVFAERVKTLGISPGSRMFVVALYNISNRSPSTLDVKVKLLKSYGWSEAELVLAFQRFPCILAFSQEKIQTAMDFLVREAGCSASYIARRPVLLGHSVQRRLMPRLQVIKSLKIKGLPGGDHDCYTFMQMAEKKFVDKYIVRNGEKAPELLQAYLAASAESI